MKRVLPWIAAACLLGIAGCYGKPDADSLVGSYKLSSKEGRQELTILKDGSYKQYFYPAGTTVKIDNIGRWEFHALNRRMEFHNFMWISKALDSLSSPTKLDALLIVSQTLNGVKIYTNEDTGEAFCRER